MKTNLRPGHLSLAAAFSFCVAFWMPHTADAVGKHYPRYHMDDPGEEKPSKKEKKRSADYSSRNNNSVKIFPDAIKREMHVVAKQNDGKEVEFFIFDLEGTLVQNYRLSPREHIRLSNLERGKYRYNVFCGDIETAAGEFEIR